MKDVRFGTVLLLACCYAHFAFAQTTLSKEANNTLRFAKDAAAKYCGSLKDVPTDSRAPTRKAFESFSSNNIILEIFTNSNSSAEVQKVAAEKLNISWLLGLAWPFILGIILAIEWFFCCWSTCGCCRCCRCCVRKRNNRWCKLFLLIPFLCACGCIIAAAVTFSGNNLIDDGSNSLLCASASLLDTALNGGTSPFFVGIAPALDSFQGIGDQLNANSPLIRGIIGLLDKTAVVSSSVYVVGQTLQQLSDAMSDPKTVYPATASGDIDFVHRCDFCAAFGNTLKPVFDSLAQGVANALAKAREEVEDQLTGSDLRELQSSLFDAMGPMIKAEDALIASFAPFVTPGQFDQYQTYYQGKSSAIYTVISVLIADCVLLLVCGGCAFGLCICCERDRKQEELGMNPYPARNHRCACATYCYHWHYAVLTFIIGGILWLVLFPLSSLCVTLEDIDKPMLLKVMPALGIEPSNVTDIGLDIVDRCLSLKSQALYSNSSRNLFDIIQVPGSNGGYSTIRQTVLQSAIDPINKQFDGISAAMTTSGFALATSPEVVQLQQKLREFTIDVMTLPDPDKMRSLPYSAMSLDTATTSGFATSMACSTSRAADKDIPGIDDFFGKLKTLGPAEPLSNCQSSNAKLISCTDASASEKGKACEGGKALLDSKMRLKRLAIYQCNVFQDPINPAQACDVYNMVKDLTGKWTNTCLFPDGTMRVFKKDCGLDEFSVYISRYSQRIGNVMSYMDDAVNTSIGDINVELRKIVSTYVINPILNILEGFDCSFMLRIYGVFVDGLCYQMGSGIRTIANAYVSCGFLALTVAFFAYILFRYTVDNFNIGMKVSTIIT